MSDFTIILPHKRNEGNDAALKVALDMLFDNTWMEFCLLVDSAYDKPLYERVNRLVEQARTDCVVYFCSDLFPARGWDIEMYEVWDPNTFTQGIVVEPGVMGIDPNNVEEDFGRTPEKFRRAEFELFARSKTRVPSGLGFPAPFMFSRQRFIDLGGLETNLAADAQGFAPADVRLFERHRAAGGRVTRAVTYFYHLQRYSETDEQQKAARQ